MILERETDLAVLYDAVRMLRRGRSSVVLVAGEPGIGKTALLTRFLAELPTDVRRWLGRCDDLVAAQPLGAIADAYRDARRADALAHPATADTLADTLEMALEAGDQAKVMKALHDELGSAPPLVFVVEDLHWADDATLDVLAHVMRRLEGLAVLLVLSYRPQDAARHQMLTRFLGAVPPGTALIAPAPLSTQAVAELSGASGWDAEHLCRITGGNPFYVTEALAGGTDTEAPTSVTAAVQARLGRLDPACRAALERISVWPGVLEFDLAEALVGDLDVLADAEQAGIVEVVDTGIRFRHEIARLATEATLPRVRRRRHDRAVIDLLKTRGEADLPRLVHHAIHCGDADSIVAYAPKAARYSARVGAQRQALRYWEAVLTHEDRLDRPDLARICDAYAWELHNAHRFDEAVAYSLRAVRLLTALGEHEALIQALVQMARHYFMQAQAAEAERCAHRAVDLVAGTQRAGPGSAAQQADALLALGAIQALSGDPEEAERTLTSALEADPDSGLVSSLATNYLAQVSPALTPDARIDLLEASLRTALAALAFEAAARAYTNLAEILYRYGRLDRLDALLEEGLAFTREHGFRSHSYNLEAHAALAAARRGRWDAADAQLRALTQRYDDPGMLVLYSSAPLTRLRVRRGDPDVEDELRSGWRVAQSMGMLLGLGYAGAAYAEWGWLSGRPDVVREVLAAWAPHARRPTAAPFDAEIRCYAARAGVATDPPSDAQPDTTPADAEAPLPWALAIASDHPAAAQAWLRLGDPYERALELAQTGDADDARESVDELERLGATPALRWVRTQLARHGMRSVPRGPLRRTRANPGGLTEREMEVAQLLREDLTNAEIARRLFLSVRTVDHHVSSILSKLGVPDRRAARARMTRLLA